MLKRSILSLFSVFLLFSAIARALDPVAPTSERKFGIIMVKGPNPDEDVVTITDGQGKVQKIKERSDTKVPVGDYTVNAKMQDYTYTQQVTVQPTERTDVVIPGYGNIKVNGFQGRVQAVRAGTGVLVAEFDTKETKTVPAGEYEVKIPYGAAGLVANISVVTNTTREVNVKIPSGKKGKNK